MGIREITGAPRAAYCAPQLPSPVDPPACCPPSGDEPTISPRPVIGGGDPTSPAPGPVDDEFLWNMQRTSLTRQTGMTAEDLDAMRNQIAAASGASMSEVGSLVEIAVRRGAEPAAVADAWRAAASILPASIEPGNTPVGSTRAFDRTESDRIALTDSALMNQLTGAQVLQGVQQLQAGSSGMQASTADVIGMAINTFDTHLDPASVAANLQQFEQAVPGTQDLHAISNLGVYDPYYGSMHSGISGSLITTAMQHDMTGAQAGELYTAISSAVPELAADPNELSFVTTQAVQKGMSAEQVAQSLASGDGQILRSNQIAIS